MKSCKYIFVDCCSSNDCFFTLMAWMMKVPMHRLMLNRSQIEPKSILNLYKYCKAPEGTSGTCKKTVQKPGFSYHTILEELWYAYIVCCPDMGHAITTLLNIFTSSFPVHYVLFKDISCYLWRMFSLGIKFKQAKT